jgi:hypothetical protein
LLAEQIAGWAIIICATAADSFYYQGRRFYKVKIPYMRWSQAWMMYALSRLLEANTGKG